MTDREGQPVKDGVTEKKFPCQVTFFLDDQVHKGTSIHFNERGILILCPQPAPLKKKIKMVLLFPGLRNPMELQGEVVWTNIYGTVDSHTPRGMGVKFLGVDREVERMLSELSVQYEAITSIYTCYYT
jgi:hypothetical protein